jgi:hypothetical protein
VEFPYGSFDATIPGLSEDEQPNTKKRKEHPVKPKGAKKFKINLLDKKFSSVHLNDLQQNIILEKHVSLPKPMKSKFWLKKSKNLIAKSVSKATWKTRKAALQKILTFSKKQKIKLHWSLSKEIINGFVIWCFANKMSPLTTNSYVFALSSIQKCLGFNPIKIKNSQAEILLKGFKNQKPPSKKLRKPVTLKILSNLKSKIEKNFDNVYLKKAIWSAFTLAFFGCLRMGEIVCKKENSFHSESAFCWGDVKIHKNYLKLNLKNTKNNDKNFCRLHF